MTEQIRVLSRDVEDLGGGIRIASASLEAPGGAVVRRRYLHTPDAVAIVAALDGQLLLVREFRAAVNATVLQVPMGKVDGGRDPLACAYAELAEETGYQAARCELVGTLMSCPGWMDQTLHVYRAMDLTQVPRPRDTGSDDIEEAHIILERLPVDQFRTAVTSGRVRDARTIAAVYLALGQLC